MYSAMTRPRIAGFTVVCTMAFAVVMNTREANPMSASDTANDSNVGMSAEIAAATPKSPDAKKIVRIRGRSCRAEMSAPVTEPIAMTELSRPNSPAPRWKVIVVMVEVKIAKFIPKVPMMNTMSRMTTMAGFVRTYRKPARICPRSREARGCGRSSLTLIALRAMSVPAKVTALIMKTQPAPTTAVRMPATAGPMSRAV